MLVFKLHTFLKADGELSPNVLKNSLNQGYPKMTTLTLSVVIPKKRMGRSSIFIPFSPSLQGDPAGLMKR
jgi:hypothetical protein